MWSVALAQAGPGTRYMFSIGDLRFPDPASRQQAGDVDGWSVVRARFGRPPSPNPLRPWHESVICEVHVGTATPEGTFRGLAQRLEHFSEAGYTGIELTPIAEFPGHRGWGYDGVLAFAPEHAYGPPDELRALVERAHQLGLCIDLDVVYNHFGQVKSRIPQHTPEFFTEGSETPWGPAIDFTKPMVRRFFIENACWWLEEFDVDGLRFDAIHEMKTDGRDQFLGELARACRAIKPDAKLVVENVRNQMHWLTRDANDLPKDFTAQWNDDFHHVLQFLVTGERRQGYEDESRDPIADLEKSLADGFVHDGDGGPDSDGRTRNEPASQLPMQAFVAFLHNHDQIGNRPDGKRIVDRVDAERLDFAHFVVLLSPQIPMFFMGEEARLRQPFYFFFDLPEPDQSRLRDDRYEQMEKIFGETAPPGSLPDPQDEATFVQSKLAWADYALPRHSEALARFRELVALRRKLIWPLAATRCIDARSARQGNGLIVTWQYAAGTYSMLLNPTDEEVTLEVSITGPAASTGRFEILDTQVRLGPWTALAWPG
jgi:malto-oligosyltrehalose trehalohydrolase